MKKFFIIVVSLTLLFIISCEKEEINNQNQKSFDLEKSKLTLQQVLKEINNEKKNDLILNSLNKDKNHLSNNFIARTSADSSNYIFNKYEKNNYVTYSLNLSTYTAETPYFLNLIVTNNNLEGLKIGYIKYIPENPISNIDLKTFTGEIQILNTDFELKASSIFNNGIRQEDNQTNSQQRLICIDYIQIIEVTCSHGGGHGVGESCGPGYTNDAHYEIIQQTRCHEINDGPEPEFIIDINPIGNNGAGGGGSAVDASINLAINNFKSTLNPAQLAIYNSNKTDFDKYLKNNSISLPDALGAYTTNINTDAEQFVLELIDFISQNPSSNSHIMNYLDEENWSNESIEFTQELIDELENINIDSYPGKEDLLPFEWWNDDALIEQYLQGSYESWRNISSEEKRLTKSFPNIAYKLYKNKDIAFQKTFQYFGNVPQVLNGKPDAFRHAFFQAINTVRVRKYFTELFANAHESEVPTIWSIEKEMDIYNNEIGMNLIEFTHPNWSNINQIATEILNMLNNGKLIYLKPINYSSPYFWDNPSTSTPNDGNHGISSNTQLTPTNQ